MKRILLVLLIAMGVFFAIKSLLPILSPAPADRDGVSAASVYHVPVSPGGEPTAILYYTGISNAQGTSILTAGLTGSAEIQAGSRTGLQIAGGIRNSASCQQVDPDHIYFVKAEPKSGHGKV